MAKKAAVAAVAAAPVVAAPEPKAPPKPKFGHDLVIDVKSLPAVNPRREGNVSHAKFEEMKAFMLANQSATVADVIAGTTYKRNDFEWDFDRGDIKVRQGKTFVMSGNPVEKKVPAPKVEKPAPAPVVAAAAPTKVSKKKAPVVAAA